MEYFLTLKRQIAQEMGIRESWEHAPRPFNHLSTHEAGVHRMGDDPASSVVDPSGESHECKGLWALGAGQFPSMGAYNPTETLQALAYLAADRLLQNLGARMEPTPAQGEA